MRLLTRFIVASVFLCFLLPCGAKDQGAAPLTIQKIKQRGILRVAVSAIDDAPFIMHNKQKQLFGLDIALITGVANRIGVKVKYIEKANFNRIIDSVESRQADIGLSDLSITLERVQRVDFTHSYLAEHVILLTNRMEKELDNQPMGYFNQPKIVIGVMSHTAYHYYRHIIFPQAREHLFTSMNQIMHALRHNQIQAILINQTQADDWFYHHPTAALYVSKTKLSAYHDPIAIALNYNQPRLLRWLDLYIRLKKMDKRITALKKYYLEGNAWQADRLIKN